jgi:hypothetical protein
MSNDDLDKLKRQLASAKSVLSRFSNQAYEISRSSTATMEEKLAARNKMIDQEVVFDRLRKEYRTAKQAKVDQ